MNIINVFDDIIIAIDEIEGSEGSTSGEGNPLTARQRERKAVRKILFQLVGNDHLKHNEAGMPLLDGYKISISHSLLKQGGYVAIMLSKSHEVGIDIEYKSDRIMKIASRFLRSDEKPATVDDHLVYWCAKEAVYKLFSDDDLTYQQMRVNGQMDEVENLKRNEKVKIYEVVNNKFVLAYTYL